MAKIYEHIVAELMVEMPRNSSIRPAGPRPSRGSLSCHRLRIPLPNI